MTKKARRNKLSKGKCLVGLLAGIIMTGYGASLVLKSYTNNPVEFYTGVGVGTCGGLLALVAGYLLSRMSSSPNGNGA